MEFHTGVPGQVPQGAFTPRRLWRGGMPSDAGHELVAHGVVAHDGADHSHADGLPPMRQDAPMPASSHVRMDAVAPSRALRIRIGTEFIYQLPAPTPMIVMLNVHDSRAGDLEVPDRVATDPIVPIETYRDGFGNICCRFVAPRGRFVLRTDGIIRDAGLSDPVAWGARQNPVEDLPADALAFLLPSRYCESDTLSNEAWRLFGRSAPGWARVQSICDFVHTHVEFGYMFSRPTRTAAETYAEGRGVCRDFTHLAVAFCRALNIPARYCMGYISDIGLPPPYEPMDLAAWMEVYLGDQWYTFDPRNNAARVGRILIARGRDAADVPLTYTFGPNQLTGFKVFTDELTAEIPHAALAVSNAG